MKKSTLAIIAIAIIAIGFISLNQEDSNVSNTTNNTSIAPTAAEAKTNDPQVPHVGISINNSMQTPEPTAAPEMIETKSGMITLSGPDTASEGETFSINFMLSPETTEKIISAGADISFDGKYAQVKEVKPINADESSMTGEIGENSVNSIFIGNNNGIAGKFMTVDFLALKPGNATMDARIIIVNENLGTSAPIQITKTIKIV